MKYSTLGITIAYFILILLSGKGTDAETEDQSSAPTSNENDVLCRIMRNARKQTFLAKKRLETDADAELVKDCVISDGCTKIICSTTTNHPYDTFELNLNLCSESGPTILFLMTFPSMQNSSWSHVLSPHDTSQRIQVPFVNNGVEYYLNATFLRLFSQFHSSDPNWSTLKLNTSLEVCKLPSPCTSSLLLTNLVFPLHQLCGFTDTDSSFILSNFLMNSPEKQALTPASFSSQIGMPCKLNDPFKCGVNSLCRRSPTAESNKDNDGTCDCCQNCDLLSNGSCVLRTTSTHDSTVPTNSDNSSMLVGVGAFFAIAFLILLGAGIFFGVKYNSVTRIRNRFRLFWSSWCSRRVVRVNENVSMFNPIDDDDEPPLL